MKRLSMAMVFLTWFAVPVSADLDTGVAAYNRGDYVTALRELKPLAKNGVASAQFTLGRMYDRGEGVLQDFKEALHWYHLAAEQGNAAAQTNIGFMYGKGQGVPHDDKEAIRWFRLAAMQEDAVAQFNLGLMYGKGRGVPQDYVQAHMWLNLAAAYGDKDSARARDLIAGQMTQSQNKEAQRLFREWKPKKSGGFSFSPSPSFSCLSPLSTPTSPAAWWSVRNLVNSGTPEKVCMQVTGHKSRSVFDRYHIVSPGDLKEATRRLVEKNSSVMGTFAGTIAPLALDAHS